MAILSDYMTGYNNGWRDAEKAATERAKAELIAQPYADVIAHLNAGGVVKLLTHDEAVADADAFRTGIKS